uniref:Gamma-butyrobetaine dioxygenase n=1 Tax=Plectus sambesii TaxID=2011161 RepID=A0A914WR44_9BILA
MWSAGSRLVLGRFASKDKTSVLISSLTAAALHTSSTSRSIDSPVFCRGFKIVSIDHEPENKILAVKWNDGKCGRYPYVWLRDTSPDPSTYTISDAMTARNLFMKNFDVEVVPKSTERAQDGSEVRMEWPCGTVSHFKSDWLRTRNISDPDTRQWRRKVYLNQPNTWGSEEIAARLKRFPFKTVMETDGGLHDFLEAVCVDGLAMLTNSPATNGKTDRGAVSKIGERIGLIQQTHFGTVYEVSTKPDASNMAYANSGELPLHADFPSLTHPPELQMLHMIERAETGGVSLFTDGFRIAELLKKEKPDVYKLLTTETLEYIEEGYDVHTPAYKRDSDALVQFDYDMCSRHKTITLNDDGQPTTIRFGNAMRSWFYDMDVEKVLPMYRALKIFTEYCYQPRNLLHLQLENGDVVLWANTRLLHARTAFKSYPGRSRTLEGCYFGWDFLRSRVRVLRDQLNLPDNQPSA